MSDIQINTHSAASRFSHLFRPAANGGATAPASTGFASDQLNLVGGAAPVGGAADGEYAKFVADTTAMLASPDVRQRFQAIINMTKMQPAEAVPLLQKAAQDSNPQVQQLAQRALTVMQQMQTAQPGAAPPAPAPGATPPAAPAPAAPAPAAPAPAAPGPAAPQAPVAAPPAPTAPVAAPQAPVAAPPPPVVALPSVAPAAVTNAGTDKNTAAVRAVEAEIKSGVDPLTVMPKLAAYAQTDRQETMRVLLTYLVNGHHAGAINQAIAILRDMKATEAVPYLEAITRQNYQTPETKKAAADALYAFGSNAGGQQGGVYQVRALEVKAIQGGSEGVQAIQQLAPLAQSNRQEVLRVVLTVLHQQKDTQSTMAAINLARQMKATEAMPYLQYIMVQSFQPEVVRQSASAAVQELNGASAAPQGAPPAAPQAQAPAATPPAAQPPAAQPPAAQPPAAQPGASTIPGFLRK